MRSSAFVLLGLGACAARTPAPIDHPLATPGAAAELRRAAVLVERGRYATAEQVLVRLFQQDDEAAGRALDAAIAVLRTGDVATARELLGDLVARWPETRGGVVAADLVEELAVIGRPAGDLAPTRWLRGSASWADAPVTLVLFWETWCPYCRATLPTLGPILERWRDDGLQIVGLVKLSQGTTATDVDALMDEHGLSFPTGQEDGAMSERFAVRGVPAMALVRDGRIVWRGHPAMLDDAAVGRALDGP